MYLCASDSGILQPVKVFWQSEKIITVSVACISRSMTSLTDNQLIEQGLTSHQGNTWRLQLNNTDIAVELTYKQTSCCLIKI